MTAPSKEALAAWCAQPFAGAFTGMNKEDWCAGFDAGRKSFADGLVPVAWMCEQKGRETFYTAHQEIALACVLDMQVTPLYALPMED